jgi:hypothetical protein
MKWFMSGDPDRDAIEAEIHKERGSIEVDDIQGLERLAEECLRVDRGKLKSSSSVRGGRGLWVDDEEDREEGRSGSRDEELLEVRDEGSSLQQPIDFTLESESEDDSPLDFPKTNNAIHPAGAIEARGLDVDMEESCRGASGKRGSRAGEQGGSGGTKRQKWQKPKAEKGDENDDDDRKPGTLLPKFESAASGSSCTLNIPDYTSPSSQYDRSGWCTRQKRALWLVQVRFILVLHTSFPFHSLHWLT